MHPACGVVAGGLSVTVKWRGNRQLIKTSGGGGWIVGRGESIAVPDSRVPDHLSDKAPSRLLLVALWWGDGGEALMSRLPHCCVKRKTGLTRDIVCRSILCNGHSPITAPPLCNCPFKSPFDRRRGPLTGQAVTLKRAINTETKKGEKSVIDKIFAKAKSPVKRQSSKRRTTVLIC